MKNIVVLKNLPSNIVDEAIVVLKANKKAKKFQYCKNKEEINKFKENAEEGNKDYIIKEAEALIADYIEKIENQDLRGKKEIKEIKRKYKNMKKVNIGLSILVIITTFICIF